MLPRSLKKSLDQESWSFDQTIPRAILVARNISDLICSY